MKFVKSNAIKILLVLFIFPNLSHAVTPGKIKGKVFDAITNQPLLGANVFLKGTSLGAATNMDGSYFIRNIPVGIYTIQVSYIGYRAIEEKIQIKGGLTLSMNFKLEPVAVQGKTVTVTSQASGQNAAINQQLASNKIVNVVSAARIQELPDANAAESVGRLPGVYLLRSGGEGYAVSIRGLEPKYNKIMIDGVEMAPTDNSDRGTDMSMISSDMLEGIEVFKTVTPDMDAAVLGGVVNFQIREAKKNASGLPDVNLSLKEGYDNLQNKYNDYLFSAGVGKRFLNNRLGVLVQGIVENKNLTSNVFGASYDVESKIFGVSNPVKLTGITLTYSPRTLKRYNASLSIDYVLPNGKIDLVNLFSQSNTNTEIRKQSYGLASNNVEFHIGNQFKIFNVMTNLLDVKQHTSIFDIDLRLSHAYSENRTPDNWDLMSHELSTGISTLSNKLNPQQFVPLANAKIDQSKLILNTISTSNTFLRQRNITGAIDLKKDITFSELITSTFKAGVMYKYTYRSYDENAGSGSFGSNARKIFFNTYPWLAQPPYNYNVNADISIIPFIDNNFKYAKFWGGEYTMGPALNKNLLYKGMRTIIDNSLAHWFNGASYTPDVYQSGYNDYSGNEYQNAAYIMATFKIGPKVIVIPGVRYQGLETSYTAPIYLNADAVNPYPKGLPHSDTTINRYHGYWLPDINLRYKPLTWFDIRVAYTSTITYPDFGEITPQLDVNYTNKSIIYNNYNLKPARAQNYDLALSIYNNSIGLFSIDGFLKQIDNLIFSTGERYVIDPSAYPGLPDNTTSFSINTQINSPFRVNLWGAELEWQTHFWYLPDPLKGLVLNINYTHIFSKAKYPYTYIHVGSYPTFKKTYIDTFYTDRLINQPNDIVNLSLGYDYNSFSMVVSMIYQADVFNGSNFWPELRSSKDSYLRWDLTLKQGLPWFGLEAYVDLNNINGARDNFILEGNGFPTSGEEYGMTADLGLRWNLQ